MAVMRSGDVAQYEVRDLINRAIDDYTAAHNRDDIAQFAVIGAAYLTGHAAGALDITPAEFLTYLAQIVEERS